MPDQATSPCITGASWGRIEVASDQTFKDVKLYPGGAREWDWTETGTHHTPGIQPADVQELVDRGAEVVVLSQGFHDRLQVRDETLEMLYERGVDVYVLNTEEAVDTYNALCESERPVGGLFHSTC